MKLFYLTPHEPNNLIFWYLVEVVLLVSNVLSFGGFVIYCVRLRIHINMKIFSIFMIIMYYPCIAARLVIIGYECSVFRQQGLVENNTLIVLCSWYRTYFLGLVITCLFWYGVERQFAMFYIVDYERKPRIWISLLLMIVAVITCATLAALYTFDFGLEWPLAIFSALLTVVGVWLYARSYLESKRIVEDLGKYRPFLKHKYSLSLKFQLQENLWSVKLVRNGFFSMSIINIPTFLAFVISNVEMAKVYFTQDTIELMDCLYNLLIPFNGAIVVLGTVAYNDYTINLCKSIFGFGLREFRTTAVVPDAGLVYFTQLKQQWKENNEMGRGLSKTA